MMPPFTECGGTKIVIVERNPNVFSFMFPSPPTSGDREENKLLPFNTGELGIPLPIVGRSGGGRVGSPVASLSACIYDRSIFSLKCCHCIICKK
jgi:hypothetical protein